MSDLLKALSLSTQGAQKKNEKMLADDVKELLH